MLLARWNGRNWWKRLTTLSLHVKHTASDDGFVSEISDIFLDGVFLGIKEGSEEFVVGTPAGCAVCRTVKRPSREDAADHVFSQSIRGTPTRPVPDDEPREPREPGEQPLRIDVCLVHPDLPPISTEPSKPRRVYWL